MRYLLVLLLCVVAALAYGQSSRQTPQNPTGRYLVVVGGEGGTVWRLDTATGGLLYCLAAIGSQAGMTREASCTVLMK